MKPPVQRRAFTLVELLVVVAIVGLLASLLLPALAKAKSRAKSAACQGNLRQIGLALRMYVDDHGKYPGDIMREDGSLFEFRWGQNWGNQLAAYIPRNLGGLIVSDDTPWHVTPTVYNCPATGRQFNPHGPLDSTRDQLTWAWQTSYGYNMRGTGWFYGLPMRDLGLGPRRVGTVPIYTGLDGSRSADTSSVRQIADGDVVAPSDMIAFGDNAGYQSSFIQPFHPGLASVVSLGDLHSAGANVLFCDGHVEYGKAERWCAPTERARSRWNNDNLPHPESWPDRP
ncbi:MAG TPA: DUF1559 domain-containing protein [Verrucomicrobiota bacterium]|nr:DUF1559 domain-containing protein [Verrucomicrobiota bacterium]